MHLERTRLFPVATALATLLLAGCSESAATYTRPPQPPTTSVTPMRKEAPLARAWDEIELDVHPMARADRDRARSRLGAGDEGLAEARKLLRGQEPLRKGVPNTTPPNAIGGGPQPAMDEDVFRQLERHAR